MPHPRYRRPAQFLFTHHGQRLSQNAVRAELDRAADDRRARPHHPAPAAPHLRHRPGQRRRLAASADGAARPRVRRDEPALRAAVRHHRPRRIRTRPRPGQAAGPHPPRPSRTSLPLADITGGADWKDTPLIKSRLAGGFCLRAPAQGACTYANICEHCPSFHADPAHCPSSPPNASTPKHSPPTPSNAAGSPKPNATAGSSPDSTP